MKLGPARWACGRAAITAATLGSLALSLGAACGPADTGILIEVGSTRIKPDRLQFVIAGEATTSQGTLFIQDKDIAVVGQVAGRDLLADPYRLLVHDGLVGSATVTAVVFAYTGNDIVGFAGLGPTAFVSDKLLLYHLDIVAPDAVERTGTECVTWNDHGTTRTIAVPGDHDCDDHFSIAAGGDDCDDENPHVNPDVTEVCANHIDDNCNGEIDESPDEDGDGFHLCDGDCDDKDPNVHPGALEICDGKDNDCNGLCDDGDGFDADGDGYTVCGSHIEDDGSCTAAAPDCNDHDPDIHPGAPEICDGKDNDCNGVCDDADGLDPDGDGFTACGTLAGLTAPADGLCGAATSALADCRNAASASATTVHPFAHEFCDGLDDNCDGAPETEEPCYADLPGPGDGCGLGTRSCKDDAVNGKPGLQGSCQAQPTAPFVVDPALCTAYDDACKDDPEPWRCASAAGAIAIFDCTLSYRLALGSDTDPPSATVCPNASVPAPTGTVTAPGCSYTLVGGTAQEGYVVGVRPLGSSGPPGAAHLGCDAELAVTGATNDFAPQPDEWIVTLGDSLALDPPGVLVFHVTPTSVAACPAVPMSCTMRVQ